MIVTTRNNIEFVVFLSSHSQYNQSANTDVLVNEERKCWFSLNGSISEDLNGVGFYENDYDIMKVELPYHPYCFQNLNYERNARKLLWERKEIKEVTMAEVEEKFGCKVKIVNNLN